MKVIWLLSAASSAMASIATALPHTMSANPNVYSEKNADGSRTPLLRLYGRGESGGYDATVEVTEDGFTVKKMNGNYMYMEFEPRTNQLISSGLTAGRDDPRSDKSKATGMMLNQNEHKIMLSKGKNPDNIETNQRHLIARIEEDNGIPNEHSHVARRRTPVLGNKKNLMVPFKFADHASRVVPSTSNLTVLMNNVGSNALCPSGSVRDVYLASSFNQLVLDSTVAPWVTLPNNETYYAAGNSGLGTMAHIMIRDALNALQATGFNFTPYDTDNDGYIDAIGFLHSGYAAEWGGTDAYGAYYLDRIWSHKWAVYSLPGGKWTSTSGKSVYNYHISPSVWGTSGSAIGRIGVIAHETGHFFGLPDLYDGSGGSGIGSYCLMANSWGFDGSQYYPPHMSAWSKIQLGWVTPTVITAAGTYTARQACTFPDIFQISKNFPTSEYLLIENRQKCSFDAKVAGPGLAVFHVDDTASYTTEGYPGQTGWPTNGNHYRVALLQADAAYNLEKGNNRGDSTDLFGATVKSIGPSGTSAGAAYPNTNAYKGGVIIDTCITIKNIATPSSSMSFEVSFVCPTAKPVTSKPVTAKPITAKPVTGKPVTSKPTTAKPVTAKPVTSKPTTGKPLTAAPTTAKPVTATPTSPKSVTSMPTTSKPVTAKPTTSKPVTAKPTTAKPVTAKPTTAKPVTAKPTTAKPVTAKPTTAKPATAKPVTAKPVTAKPVTSKPVTAKPVTAVPIPKPKPVPAPVPKPAKPAPKPAAPVPKPAKPVPKPVAPVPKPAKPVPKPAPKAPVSCVSSGLACTTSSACCSNVCKSSQRCQ